MIPEFALAPKHSECSGVGASGRARTIKHGISQWAWRAVVAVSSVFLGFASPSFCARAADEPASSKMGQDARRDGGEDPS